MSAAFLRFFRLLVPGLLLVLVGVPAVRADELMRTVQEELRKRNLYFGDVDGLSSPQVAAALRRYQQRKGFQPTGEADNITLSSLNLTGPAGATPSSSPRTPDETPVVTTKLPPPAFAPWPNLPVLHSDEARVNPIPNDSESAVADADPPPQPPKPPPAAAFQRWPAQEAVQGFVEEFVRQGESNVPGAQTDFFADHVDYFNEGVVSREFIDKDTTKYNKRWPDRHFALLPPLKVEPSPDGDPEKIVVSFLCLINVKKPGHDVKGEADETYTLQRTGPESLRIVAIKESRVRSK